MSNYLGFEKLPNTRDIGGLTAKDGSVIKKGLLYRSGFLLNSTEEDIRKVSEYGLTKIIDFRSYSEMEEQPDPAFPGAEHIHLPAEDEAALGIDRDQKSQQNFTDFLMSQVLKDPTFAIKYMSGMYRRFISNRYTAGQYRRFLKILLDAEGPVLWHCTAGKDRAGFGAILIEEILGIDRDDIMESYMLSNICLKEDIEELTVEFEKTYRGEGPYPAEEVKLFFAAREEYVEALYDEADREYGSFENYLVSALGADADVKKALRKKYLE